MTWTWGWVLFNIIRHCPTHVRILYLNHLNKTLSSAITLKIILAIMHTQSHTDTHTDILTHSHSQSHTLSLTYTLIVALTIHAHSRSHLNPFRFSLFYFPQQLFRWAHIPKTFRVRGVSATCDFHHIGELYVDLRPYSVRGSCGVPVHSPPQGN